MKSIKTIKISILIIALVLSSVVMSSCFENKTLTLNNDKIKLTVGDTATLTPNVDSKDITWSSSDLSVAMVNDGKVTALAKGEAVITAMLESGEKATCEVEITDVAVNSIQLNPSSLSVKVGNSESITPKLSPDDASVDSLVWNSNDSSIASVNSSGVVTGVKGGTTVVTCVATNGKSANCTVKVIGPKKKKVYTTPAVQPTEAPAPQTPPADDYDMDDIYYNTLCNDFVTLRDSPSTKADEICKVYKGEPVTYLDSVYDSEFMEVEYNGEVGYVMKVFFTPSKNPGNRAVYYCRARVDANLRSNPGSNNADNIKKIPRGAPVQYLGSTIVVGNQEYARVEYKYATGYIFLDAFSTNPKAPTYTGK